MPTDRTTKVFKCSTRRGLRGQGMFLASTLTNSFHLGTGLLVNSGSLSAFWYEKNSLNKDKGMQRSKAVSQWNLLRWRPTFRADFRLQGDIRLLWHMFQLSYHLRMEVTCQPCLLGLSFPLLLASLSPVPLKSGGLSCGSVDLGTTTPAYLVPGPRLVKCEHYCLIKECLSVSLRSQHDSYVPGGVGGEGHDSVPHSLERS